MSRRRRSSCSFGSRRRPASRSNGSIGSRSTESTMSEDALQVLDNEVLPLRMIGDAAMRAVGNGQAVQSVRGSYATAVACQVPRQLDQVRRRIEDEGRLAGEEFYYGWGAGKDRVEGA